MESLQSRECTEGDSSFILNKLIEFNLSQVPATQEFHFRDVSRKIVDENGKIVAGVIGKMNVWGCLHIDFLWVDREYRGKGLGARILSEIETAAKELGCYQVNLDTYDFQAKDFYLKQGYRVFGTLENCPPNHKKYFLEKSL